MKVIRKKINVINVIRIQQPLWVFTWWNLPLPFCFFLKKNFNVKQYLDKTNSSIFSLFFKTGTEDKNYKDSALTLDMWSKYSFAPCINCVPPPGNLNLFFTRKIQFCPPLSSARRVWGTLLNQTCKRGDILSLWKLKKNNAQPLNKLKIKSKWPVLEVSHRQWT